MHTPPKTTASLMKRRAFLQRTIAGAGALSASFSGRPQDRPTPNLAPMRDAEFPFSETTVQALQSAMDSGRLTAVAIARAYLERIEALDQRGPALRSVLELNPDALAIAETLDQERKNKGPRGPLHGIPVLIKDNLDTHDRMTTTAGSLALAGSIPARDAFVVQRLRAAGAVLLGKTNLSEWANFRSTRSSSGWSGRGGQTKNPYALDRNPCGSSSGSAVAVSSNLCALAIGTETDGSVVCPSSVNGVVGIKPTLGLLSRSGIIPIAHSQDTAGPMARTVADAAILLGALTGLDPTDPATSDSAGHYQQDYARYLNPAGLRGARLGVARKFLGENERVDQLMENAISEMKRQGAEIIDPADLPTHGKFGSSEFEVLLYEFKADLNAYLERLGPNAPARTLADLIRFNEEHKDREMPYFGQEIFLRAQEKGPLTEEAYQKALSRNHRLARKAGIDAVMDKHQLDAIIAPTSGVAWTTDLILGDHGDSGCSTPAAVAGYPHVTVPAGFVFGLPVGLSFFGRAFSEPTLIRLAYAFEQNLPARRPPKFLPTADLKLPG